MTTSPPVRQIRDLSGLLDHASHVLATRMSAAFTELGITPRAYCVLFHAMEAERTQIQLAELADLDKTTMVVTVDELEKAGLAERRPSAVDRRARIISVTEAGERAVEQGTAIADRVHRDVLEALPEDERTAFLVALTRLVGGPLAEPVESERTVRRARRSRG
ncbi:MarR family winged helix-turn-helix transcriptional regulator [Kitasatospora purpeofusca]|uniref:MarR family winged helix-turn-helix transcriptional regulator n=1 Tax=Kitasatospora purpeofusca TaxID=67352 RepID=UPI002253E65A|nr:MarR family winged helix-turn-helix transcriptional regulator [Kitasatospora purpeofusca]MCX4753489.1 MarR family winged helix-turn-helix transcriptional regulator [Kitasatospora purpeofusca]WSR32985.1 MarR family winged helix-turn-helix transcriptional regulator [Kitasatospora purpeofusca]WSR41054.1 MarR family winged helix-turn-helix transcriptional regulator [Kitasatospora purpeofusca]